MALMTSNKFNQNCNWVTRQVVTSVIDSLTTIFSDFLMIEKASIVLQMALMTSNKFNQNCSWVTRQVIISVIFSYFLMIKKASMVR